MNNPVSDPSAAPSDAVAGLLQTLARLRQRGDTQRARALAHVLTSQYPGDPRSWHALIAVSDDADELAVARARLDTLAAHSPAATVVLDAPPTLQAAPATPPTALPAPEATHDAEALPPDLPHAELHTRTAPPASRPRLLPVYAILIVIMLIVLVFLLLSRFAESSAPQPTPTPPLSAIGATTPDAALPTPLPLPTATTGATAPALPEATPVPEPTPERTPEPTSQATTLPAVPLLLGAIMAQGDWQATLLRADHALVLDGAIGTLQPRGRFVLVLLAVRNNGALPARIPEELLVVVDDRNRRYLPIPPASTAYLNAFGRGLRGDLSQEELVQPGMGLISMPLIFDVPRDVRGLSANPIGQSSGWSIALP